MCKIWSVDEWKKAGDTITGDWGYILRVGGYNNPGEPFMGDTYYIAVVFNVENGSRAILYSGCRTGNTAKTTWTIYK